MTNKEKIKALIESGEEFKIFATMYGGTLKNDKVLEINLKHNRNCYFSRYDDGFFYVWGWPGPDMNFYKWEDYGKKWAFTTDDFEEKVIFYE
jgi:hypothetical protein